MAGEMKDKVGSRKKRILNLDVTPADDEDAVGS